MTNLRAEVLSLRASTAIQAGDWLTATQAAYRALALAPLHYRYLDQTAFIETRNERPQNSYRLRIQALRQRPGWPYAWAELAKSALVDGQHPERLVPSLKAVQWLGDQERGLWALFAILAVDHSAIPLSGFAQQYLQQALRRELVHRPQNLLGYALLRRREKVVCDIPEGHPTTDYLCDSARYMRQSCETMQPLSIKQQQWCDSMMALWQQFSY